MSQPAELRKQTRHETKKRILEIAQQNRSRPILVGDVALKIGPLWSLEETTNLLDELVDEGHLRGLTSAEVLRFNLQLGYFLIKQVV